jgi:signal transduction histidine kinase
VRGLRPTLTLVAVGWLAVAILMTFGIRQAAVASDTALRWGDAWPAPALFAGTWAMISLPMILLARRVPLADASAVWRVALALLVRLGLIGFGALLQLATYYLVVTALDWPSDRPTVWQDGGGWLFLGRHYEDLAIGTLILAIDALVQRFRVDQQREVDSARRDALLAEARLAALGMELQPHFLFNTLNAIASLVHHDAATADRMLARLSTLLRKTLEAGREPTAPIHDEFELLGMYLSIQQLRFGARLTVHTSVQPEAEDGVLPRFMLQPMVENALQHGLAPKRGPLTLWLTASRDGDVLECEVRDDGIGIPAGGPIREGTGVSNTRARLQAIFPDTHEFLIAPGRDGGTIVRVRVPFLTEVSPPLVPRIADARIDR